MSYIINNSRGQIVAVVGDGTVNTTATDLSLVGRAVTNYGEYQNENYVYLLENFANDTAPTQPILGQLWYNSSTDVISAYSTANTWAALASQQYVENAKISPVFTGVPTAPTAAVGTNTTQLATTAFVTTSPAFAGTPTAPTAAISTNTTQVATTAFVQNNKVSPAFTGVPTAPTAVAGTNTTQLATTAFVQIEKVSPAFSGIPTAPTAVAGTNTTQLATTAFVTDSPAFAGVPTAPTAVAGTNTTQLATTAFVTTSPAFLGVPTAPTASSITSNSQIATTAFVYNFVLDKAGGPLGTMASQNASNVLITGGSAAFDTPVPVSSGGTGGSTPLAARTNLGIGGMGVQEPNLVDIVGGTITGIIDLAIADGGTGASNAADARNNLGLGSIALQSNTNVNITGGNIAGITDLAIADGGTGASTAAGARINLGLGNIPTTFIPGTVAVQNSNSINITGGSITGITDLAIADGGTGASTAFDARVNLGLGNIPTTFIPGTIASQNASAVAITGGSITGISDLAVADGGTGASSAAGARTNLGAVATTTQIIAGGGLAGGGDLSTNRTLSIATNSNGYGTRYVSVNGPSGGNDGDIWYQI